MASVSEHLQAVAEGAASRRWLGAIQQDDRGEAA